MRSEIDLNEGLELLRKNFWIETHVNRQVLDLLVLQVLTAAAPCLAHAASTLGLGHADRRLARRVVVVDVGEVGGRLRANLMLVQTEGPTSWEPAVGQCQRDRFNYPLNLLALEVFRDILLVVDLAVVVARRYLKQVLELKRYCVRKFTLGHIGEPRVLQQFARVGNFHAELLLLGIRKPLLHQLTNEVRGSITYTAQNFAHH